jgi:hypothetical protein
MSIFMKYTGLSTLSVYIASSIILIKYNTQRYEMKHRETYSSYHSLKNEKYKPLIFLSFFPSR